MIIFLIVGCCIAAVIGYHLGELNGKGNGLAGAVLGAMLGPVGWVIAVILERNPDAEGEPPPAQDLDGRIARLEAELAQLKQARKKSLAAQIGRSHRDTSADGEIPTYRLD